jgi:hypothetical protein
MTDSSKKRQGHQPGKPLNEAHKQKIAAGRIMQRLRDNAEGKLEMSASQIRAAEVFLSKTVPSLSAVEQTNINEADSLTPEQLQASLIAMLEDKGTRQLLRNMLKGYQDTLEGDNSIVSIAAHKKA